MLEPTPLPMVWCRCSIRTDGARSMHEVHPWPLHGSRGGRLPVVAQYSVHLNFLTVSAVLLISCAISNYFHFRLSRVY